MIANAQEARAKTEAAIAKQEEQKQQNINVLYYSILKGLRVRPMKERRVWTLSG